MEAPLKTILVIDDEEFISNLIAMNLKKEGYQVIVRNDYDSSIQVINEGKIDIVVSDVMLPSTGGMDLLEYIKSKPGLKHIPVILVTGMDKESLINGKAKAEAILTKPFDMRELMQVIKSNLPKATETPSH